MNRLSFEIGRLLLIVHDNTGNLAFYTTFLWKSYILSREGNDAVRFRIETDKYRILLASFVLVYPSLF